MERGAEADGLSLYVEAVSPTGDEERRLGVFFDEGGVPSVRVRSLALSWRRTDRVQRSTRQVSAVLDIVGAISETSSCLSRRSAGSIPVIQRS